VPADIRTRHFQVPCGPKHMTKNKLTRHFPKVSVGATLDRSESQGFCETAAVYRKDYPAELAPQAARELYAAGLAATQGGRVMPWATKTLIKVLLKLGGDCLAPWPPPDPEARGAVRNIDPYEVLEAAL
jgi:hypothetical protein